LDVQGVFQCLRLRVEVSKVKAATETAGNYPQNSHNFPQNSCKTPANVRKTPANIRKTPANIRKSQNDGELTFSDSQGLWMAPTWQCRAVKCHETLQTPEITEKRKLLKFSRRNLRAFEMVLLTDIST